MDSTLSINPSDPSPILAQVPSVIAGFWRRLLAAFIDALVVGAVGFIFGLIFFDPLMRLGEWGPLVGFAISLPYFCLMNSSIGGGQTLGKRLLGVRVVNASGGSISPARAAVRYTALSLPFFLNGIMLPASMGGSIVGTAIETIVFVAGGAIIYLYLFNRATRQSLHDLIVGTYVIDSATQGKVDVRPLWKGHPVVLTALLLVGIGYSTLIEPRLARSNTLSGLIPIVEKLLNSKKVYGANVMKMTYMGTGGTAHRLEVRANWRSRPGDLPRARAEIASMVLDQAPDILGQDTLVITVSYGFDIGIASGWRSETDSGTPAEWRVKINQANLRR
jgi:uncharacterized RDD family membrane protein YckC